MKILSVHNSYQSPGGEDQVFAQEADLLQSHRHEVLRYHTSNDQLKGQNPLRAFSNTVWNQQKFRDLVSLLRQERPDLVHVHNTFAAISPAVYYAARREGIPVVQTLHNYRMLCPAGTLFRDGQVCEACVGKKLPWPGLVHGCYRDSRLATAAGGAMLATHNYMHTWSKTVSAYIALSDFSRNKFIQAGFPAEKIHVKPNFLVNDPGVGDGRGNYAFFIGRLTQEKGINTLLEAWREIGKKFPLQIAGDGPLATEVERASRSIEGVTWLKWLSREEVWRRMKDASVLISPSTWYEPFGLNLIEAFATGLPVIASNLGSMSTMIAHERTGLHFLPGNAKSLVGALQWWMAHPDEAKLMRANARLEYETKYTAEKNYAQMIDIYGRALKIGDETLLEPGVALDIEQVYSNNAGGYLKPVSSPVSQGQSFKIL
jgi:glycosyltransferase involved in cell wall biosynthesis